MERLERTMNFLKNAMLISAMGLVSASSQALTVNYGWEDGGTILGGFSSDHLSHTNTDALAHSGNRALLIEDNDAADNDTAQSYVAWINGLQTGDQVSVDFWAWDASTGNSAPSVRIWAHYTDNPNDVTDYDGSASGNNTYNIGESTWDNVSHTWTFDAASSFGGDATGLMIEARFYDSSTTTTGAALIDDLTVTVSRETAIITTPAVSQVPVPAAAWLFGSALVALAGIGRNRKVHQYNKVNQ